MAILIATYFYVVINRYSYQSNQLIRVDKLTEKVETYNGTNGTWIADK